MAKHTLYFKQRYGKSRARGAPWHRRDICGGRATPNGPRSGAGTALAYVAAMPQFVAFTPQKGTEVWRARHVAAIPQQVMRARHEAGPKRAPGAGPRRGTGLAL